MYRAAIASMPLKIPLSCILTLTLTLASIDIAGLVAVKVTLPPPRLLILIAIYLAFLSAITYLHIKILDKEKVSVKCSSKVD